MAVSASRNFRASRPRERDLQHGAHPVDHARGYNGCHVRVARQRHAGARLAPVKRGPDARRRLADRRFEESRPRLHALAYRMLGSHAEADDAVQETWLRLRRNDPDEIENVGGLLTTVVGRVCLDRLRARRARPEDPVDDLAAERRARRRPHRRPGRRGAARRVGGHRARWWCSIGSGRPSGWRSCCTTCSACRSTTSPRSSAAAPTRRVSSRAGLVADCRAARPTGVSTSCANATSSTRSCAPRAAATSTRSCSCSIPTSSLLPDAAAVAMGSLRETRGAEAVAERAVGRRTRCDARDRRRRRRVRVGARWSDPRRRAVHGARRPHRRHRRHRRRRAHRASSTSSRSTDACHISLARRTTQGCTHTDAHRSIPSRRNHGAVRVDDLPGHHSPARHGRVGGAAAGRADRRSTPTTRRSTRRPA